MSNEWKIYTRKGDTGETSLIGGSRVPKYHIRIEAYGTLDELNSFIGLIRDSNIDEVTKLKLIQIQNQVFTVESRLAADSEESLKNLPTISEADIEFLEHEIDFMNETLPPITTFILPGGHIVVSYAHIARTISRRAERIIFRLQTETFIEEVILKYINRLSDYFFVLSRKFSSDFKTEEIAWRPR